MERLKYRTKWPSKRESLYALHQSLHVNVTNFETLRANIVGKWIVEAVALDKNGSIWLIEDGVSSEITLTKYWNKS